MSSYLSQFNYQFIRPKDADASPDDYKRSDLRRFVFLHGLMGYGQNWLKIATRLRPNDISLFYDQRGHGKSMQPMTGYSPREYAEDLRKIVQEIGWDRFILVGHSMGGRNALMYGFLYPESLEKLVIEDIGPEAKPTQAEYYKRMLGAIPTPFPTKLAAKEYFMNEFPKSAFAGSQPQTLGQFLYSNILERPDGTADWRFRREAIIASVADGRGQDHWEELKKLTVPTLLIHGVKSSELDEETYQKMLAANPRIRGVQIPNAGHWVHSDQPAEFLKALLDFTDR